MNETKTTGTPLDVIALRQIVSSQQAIIDELVAALEEIRDGRGTYSAHGMSELARDAIENAKNVRLRMWLTSAPHVCADPTCPGNRNRRMLQAAEKMRAFIGSFYLPDIIDDERAGYSLNLEQIDRFKKEYAKVIAAYDAAKGPGK